jgi:hypothetical protein
MASHQQIGGDHSCEATAAAAPRHLIDDSTVVRDGGHASRMAPRCAKCPNGVRYRSVMARRRHSCRSTAGQRTSAASPLHLYPKSYVPQQTRVVRPLKGLLVPCLQGAMERASPPSERQRGPTRVNGVQGPTGRRDELRHHPFWGARKKGRQKLARRKCRRHETLGENDSNPQISLWVAVLDKSRRRPTLPRGLPLSTIGAGGLNCRVRKGNGCVPTAMATGNLLSRGSTQYGRP